MNNHWSDVSVITKKKISSIYLDNKPLLTIEKNQFQLRNKKIANIIKNEIEDSKKRIDFKKLFYYTIISFGIDKIKNNKSKYLQEIYKYINTDLICYRADKPSDLVKLQDKMWNPILDRLGKESIKFDKFVGVMPQSQPKKSIEKFKNNFKEFDEFEISTFLKLTQITGSALLAYALLKKYFNEKYVFDCSVLDEKWQSKQWGTMVEIEKRHKIHFLKIKKIKLLLNALG